MARPKAITIASILVLVMILVGALWPLIGGDQLFGLGGTSFRGQGRSLPAQGNLPGNAQGQTPQNNQGQPGQNNQAQLPQGQNGTGNFPGRGTRPQFGGNNGLGGRGFMQVWRVLQYVLYALVIILGLIAFGGLWTWKRWGSVMAIITSALVAAIAAVSLFGVFSAVTLIEDIVKIALAVGIILLVVLTRPKQAAEVKA